MTDAQIAKRITELVSKLNEALAAAAVAELVVTVDLEFEDTMQFGEAGKRIVTSLDVDVYKRIA